MSNNITSEEKKEVDIKRTGGQISLLRIYFKELGVVRYSREENYGLMDVVGNGLCI